MFFVSCVVGFYRSQSQNIAAQTSQALAKVQHVRLCCEVAGFCSKGWDCLWALVSIHLEASSAVVRPANTCMETRLNINAYLFCALFYLQTAGFWVETFRWDSSFVVVHCGSIMADKSSNSPLELTTLYQPINGDSQSSPETSATPKHVAGRKLSSKKFQIESVAVRDDPLYNPNAAGTPDQNRKPSIDATFHEVPPPSTMPSTEERPEVCMKRFLLRLDWGSI